MHADDMGKCVHSAAFAKIKESQIACLCLRNCAFLHIVTFPHLPFYPSLRALCVVL